jgi:MFS transporter, MHS family, proline/betaine transporter
MSNQKYKKSIIFSSLVGNALEFYDFTLCGLLVGLFGKLFFPPVQNEISEIFGGIFVFATAFITRPLGAFVFGYIGDVWGRKKALTFSIFLMAVPTFIIAILPTYEQIGIYATVILLICRLLQGLCTGGEYNGAAIFSLEHHKDRQGVVSGLISASCVFGTIIATLATYYVLSQTGYHNSWRFLFLFGALSAVVGFLIRVYSFESHDFQNKKIIQSLPIVHVIKNYSKQYILTILSGAFNGVLSYTLFGFLPIYMSLYVGLKIELGILYNIFGLVAFMLTCLFSGKIYDLMDKKYYPYAIILTTVSCGFTGFYFLSSFNSFNCLVLGQIILGIGVGFFVGSSHAFLQNQFNSEVRYTGVASGFSIGMALTGGTTAFLLTFLLQKYNFMLIPAIYISIIAVIWFLAVINWSGLEK